MRRIEYIIILTVCLLLGGCTQKVEEFFLTADMVQKWEQVDEDESFLKCNDNLSYVPDTITPFHENMRLIRVNFHYMNTVGWENNYYGPTAIQYTKDLLYHANRKLVYNKKMNLPEGNDTPVYDPLYQYILEEDGVYFHADDEMCFYVNEGKSRNNYNRKVIQKYKIDEDSVLNVFYMVHPPDSIKSPTYSASASGVALGKSLKLGTIYKPEDKPWAHAALLNHEVAHVMGLSHTWNVNDGCDDTPKNDNCWNTTKTGKCSGVISNNLMDYNSNQHAISPCQIGKMRQNMAKLKSRQRDLLKRTWCKLDESKNVNVTGRLHFTGAKDLEGNVLIKEGGSLRISCRVSMPAGSQIIVEPGGVLILDNAHIHNDCGQKWDGIVVRKIGSVSGEVYSSGQFEMEDTTNGNFDEKV